MKSLGVFAAVLLLDAVAFGVLQAGIEIWRFRYLANVISGLAVGQVLLAAVWLALRPKHGVTSVLVPLAMLLAGSLIRQKLGFFQGFQYFDYFARNTLQGLACLLPLWLLVRTSLWRRVSGDIDSKRLRFGFKEIFAWTTGAALFATLLGRASWANGQPLAIQFWMGLIAPAVVGWGGTFVSRLPIAVLARVGLQLAVGAGVGVALAKLGGRPLEAMLAVEFASQAAVIAAGLGIAYPPPPAVCESTLNDSPTSANGA